MMLGAVERSSLVDSAVGARGGEEMVLDEGTWLDEKIWLTGRGRREPAPATTERARWRKELGWGSSPLGGGGGGSSLSILAEADGGRGLPDIRSGFFSRTVSNSLCWRRRPIMFSTYSVRALFESLSDLASSSRRR